MLGGDILLSVAVGGCGGPFWLGGGGLGLLGGFGLLLTESVAGLTECLPSGEVTRAVGVGGNAFFPELCGFRFRFCLSGRSAASRPSRLCDLFSAFLSLGEFLPP